MRARLWSRLSATLVALVAVIVAGGAWWKY